MCSPTRTARRPRAFCAAHGYARPRALCPHAGQAPIAPLLSSLIARPHAPWALLCSALTRPPAAFVRGSRRPRHAPLWSSPPAQTARSPARSCPVVTGRHARGPARSVLRTHARLRVALLSCAHAPDGTVCLHARRLALVLAARLPLSSIAGPAANMPGGWFHGWPDVSPVHRRSGLASSKSLDNLPTKP